MTDLQTRLAEVAKAPVLLVGCDFDGTMAPIVPDPGAASAEAGAMAALASLVAGARTHLAIISGRSLRVLEALTGAPPGVILVGGHGAEWETGLIAPMRAETEALLRKLGEALDRIAERTPGATVERKRTGVAFHYRRASTEDGERALDEVRRGPGSWPGVKLVPGKMVLELTVLAASKGLAVQMLRERVGASAVLFIGDDVTDEEAFATLRPPDLGVKVGPGATVAEHRIGSPTEVVALLAKLAELRDVRPAAADVVPIERHAILSDQRSIAMVTPTGRLNWLCLPRIDSAALFADLVGGPEAGYFEVRGAEGTPRQSYEGDSFVLRTDWGGVSVVDYMDCAGGRSFQRAGRTDVIRVVEGEGAFKVVFAPRVDFGRATTKVKVTLEGIEVEGGADPIVLHAAGLAWKVVDEGRHQTAIAEGRVERGSPVVMELRYGTRNVRPAILPESERRAQTLKFWSSWSGALRVPPLHADLVRRSALVIRALCHGPTGAIAAAATTSLPESIGGVRNWDYRFCWPRDAALAAAALVRLGNTGVALRLMDWIMGVLGTLESPDRLRPIYTVTGSNLGAEAEIGELSGYAGSRPVRVGNAAAQQVQLDVFGPITDLVALLGVRGAPLTPEHWRLVQAMVSAVQSRWQEPDHGIWEIRAERRHHVHTKVMCWQTMDRAITVADIHLGSVPDGWAALREAIKAEVLEKGFDAEVGAFTTAYGVPLLDAAVLHVCLSGMLPPDDPRVVSTVEAVERGLREGPTVYRYRFDDGLPGVEGGFHICAGWLAECYAMMGRRERAMELLDGIGSLAGPLGLLPEQYDPVGGRSLGNHAQAYSHLAVINAAVRMENGQTSKLAN